MNRWSIAVLFCALSAGTGHAGPLLPAAPEERLEGRVWQLEYLRPWGDVPVHEGRSVIGVRTRVLGRIGAVAESMHAPTVRELGLGVWVQPVPWLRLEGLRQETEILGLERTGRLSAELDLALRRPQWAVGAWVSALRDPLRTVVRRTAWVSLRVAGTEAFVARESQPWTGQPVLAAGIQWRVFGRVRAGAHWRSPSVGFSIGWDLVGMRVESTTVWSGPQTGAFGFRVGAP